MQFLSNRCARLVSSDDRGILKPLPYFPVCRVCLGAAFPEYVLHGTLTDFPAGQVRDEFRNPFERDALDNIEICHKRTDVVSVLDTAVGGVAIVHAATLADLLVILLLTRLNDKLDVYDLCLADFPVPHAVK